MKLEIRPVQDADIPRVVEIALGIWEGADEEPELFRRWLDDPRSEFMGVWSDGRLIAYGRIVFIQDGVVWLEGLKKDAKAGVRGIARLLTQYFLSRLEELAVPVLVAFSTYFGNIESIRSAQKLGFRQAAVWSMKELDLEENPIQPSPSDSVVVPADSAVFNPEHSPYLTAMSGFIVTGWTVYRFEPEVLEKGHSYTIEGEEKDNKILLYPSYRQKAIWISLLDASSKENLRALIARAGEISRNEGFNRLFIVLPSIKFRPAAWLEEAGFQSWEKNDDFLYFTSTTQPGKQQ